MCQDDASRLLRTSRYRCGHGQPILVSPAARWRVVVEVAAHLRAEGQRWLQLWPGASWGNHWRPNAQHETQQNSGKTECRQGPGVSQVWVVFSLNSVCGLSGKTCPGQNHFSKNSSLVLPVMWRVAGRGGAKLLEQRSLTCTRRSWKQSAPTAKPAAPLGNAAVAQLIPHLFGGRGHQSDAKQSLPAAETPLSLKLDQYIYNYTQVSG